VGLILGIAAAAVYYVTRSDEVVPVRYTAEATISIPSTDNSRNSRTRNVTLDEPSVLQHGQEALALGTDTVNAARAAANLPNDAAINLGANDNDTHDEITLSASGSSDQLVGAFINQWPGAFLNARSKLVRDSLEQQQQDLVDRITAMNQRRQQVESELRLRLPVLPAIVLTTGNSNGNSDATTSDGTGSATSAAPAITYPPDTPMDTVLLLFERNALYNHLADAQADYAELKVDSPAPNPYASVLGIGAAIRSGGKKTSPLLPMAAIVLGGLVLGLAAAVVRDRLDKTIRSPRTASRTLSAPVLSMIPPRRRNRGEYTVLEAPTAERSLAFRSLAATSIATDRLPRAILVSTPRGESQDDVAANFAAALATLGLRVALIGTTPRQGWFAWPFRTPDAGLATFPDFLALARSGRLNGQVERNVAFDDLNPNLVVIPPGDSDQLFMPLDGLPTLLESLRRSDVDITVIAGPALLEDPNATIIAWATRSVLWAVEMGAATEQDLTEASNRLQLAGVTPFGVAVIGPEAE
jgi:Mrp family chromosome partitioning ATPase